MVGTITASPTVPVTQRAQLHQAMYDPTNGVESNLQTVVPLPVDTEPLYELPALVIGTIDNANSMTFLVLVCAMSKLSANLTLPRHPSDLDLQQPTLMFSTTVQVNESVVKDMHANHPPEFRDVIAPFKAYSRGPQDGAFTHKPHSVKTGSDPSISVQTPNGAVEIWAHPKRPKALNRMKTEVKGKLKNPNLSPDERTALLEQQKMILAINTAYNNLKTAKQENQQKRETEFEEVIKANKSALPYSFLGATLQIEIKDPTGNPVKRAYTTTAVTSNTDPTQNGVHLPINAMRLGEELPYGWMDSTNVHDNSST